VNNGKRGAWDKKVENHWFRPLWLRLSGPEYNC